MVSGRRGERNEKATDFTFTLQQAYIQQISHTSKLSPYNPEQDKYSSCRPCTNYEEHFDNMWTRRKDIENTGIRRSDAVFGIHEK